VGLYGRAQTLMLAAVHILTAPLDTVLFPAFSEAQPDPAKLRLLFGKTQVLAMLICLPPALVMIVAPEGLILVMLGPKWIDAAPLLRVFAVLLIIRVNGRALDLILRARARVYRRLALTLTFCGLTAGFVIAGAQYGLTGVAIGLTLAFLGHGILLARVANRELGIPWFEFLACLMPPLAWAGLIGGLLLGVNAAWLTGRWHPILILVLDTAAIGLLFVLTLWLRPTLMFGRQAATASTLMNSLLAGRLERLGFIRRPSV
jgi:lipopolysaccharide exporter